MDLDRGHSKADPVAQDYLRECVVVRSRPASLVGSKKDGRGAAEFGPSGSDHLEDCR
jgi:hypothetical protein